MKKANVITYIFQPTV